jgi:putative spermidine/putrescine transport system ATP-binding protein
MTRAVRSGDCADTPMANAGVDRAGVRRASGGALALRALVKRYPNFVAVDGIDLDLAPGEFVTLLGPSGSGKTTTLMMIAGFTPPSAGDILLNGRSVTALAPERRNIGVVFQNYALFPHMTVQENIGFPLRMRNQPKAAIASKVANALRLVQLENLGERLPRQLSGGQQQRIALARALVFDPDLLLMDEPLGALDKNLREQMQFELKRLHAELGVTILYVTHDQEEALTMSDRIALMNKGSIVQVGTAEDLYERPANRFVAAFIGESNVIEGRVVEDGVFVATSGARFPLGRTQDPAVVSAATSMMVRPEKFSFAASPEQPDALIGKVAGRIYVGDCTRYLVEVAGGLRLIVKVQNRRTTDLAQQGELVGLLLDSADARLLSG